MKLLITLSALLFSQLVFGQVYFPPVGSDDWLTSNPEELGWCQESIDTLYEYLESRNSKSFMILKDGKIVLESYFNGHSDGAIWYWASAGKTITATLVGAAIEDDLVNLTDPVSNYLGEGWSQCPLNEELQRTVLNQLTMTSSFNNSPLLWDCVQPACFQCTGLAAGSQWHYHNGVYRRLIEVVEAATGLNRNVYSTEKIKDIIGMDGFWTDNLYWSNARSMARFGLLASNSFNWDNTPVLTDTEFISNLTSPSQDLNPSYGYLWWLNGQSSHMFPLDPNVYDGWLIPSAPEDMYAALGANDQKIYIVPSQGLVVIRQGDEAYQFEPAISGFDIELWELISNLNCDPLNIVENSKDELLVFPNPAHNYVQFDNQNVRSIEIFNSEGQLLVKRVVHNNKAELDLKPGLYFMHIQTHSSHYVRKISIW